MSQPDLNARNGWYTCSLCLGIQPLRGLVETQQHDEVLNLTSTLRVCADGRICALMKAMRAEAQQRDLDIAVSHHEAVQARVAEGEKRIEAKRRRKR